MYYTFGDYILNTAQRELAHAGVLIPLEPKGYQILAYLIQHRDRLVTREELLELVWSDVYVDDSAVARCIGAVRKAVGDSRERQDVIQTRRGQGYRFVATVVVEDDTAMCPEVPKEPEAGLLDCRQPTPLNNPEPCVRCGEAMSVRTAYCPTCGHSLAPVFDFAVAEYTHGTMVSPGVGERKPVTVLCGVLDMASTLDLDTLDDLMEAFVPLVKWIVRPYDGYIEHVASDRIDVCFGVPETQEDHAQRAALAAFALQRQWKALLPTFGLPAEAKIALRIGLHTGLVAVTGREAYPDVPLKIVGDTVTLAAQVALQAEVDQVVVSGAVAPFISNRVHLELQEPLSIASPFDLIPFYHAVKLVPEWREQTSWDGRPKAPLIGRESELALLRTYLDRATAGQGKVVGIMGEAGMGKSRLLQAFCTDAVASGAKFLTGHCRSYGTGTPYLALSRAIQQWVGMKETDDAAARAAKVRNGCQALEVDLDTCVPYILHLLDVEEGSDISNRLHPPQHQAQTFAALYQLITRCSQRQPLILVIEDMHWIDPSTEAFLSSLVEAIDRLPVLLLLTYRSGYQSPWGKWSVATQIALSPLSDSEGLELMQATLQDQDLHESDYRLIEAQAQGNPFFLEELTRAFGMQEDDGTGTLNVPGTVQTLLAARIDRLAPNAKHVFQIAAVFGSQIPLAPLQTVIGWPEAALNESLEQLRAAELLYQSHLCVEPTYIFKHPLVQEVAYASLLRRTQRELQQRIAQMLIEPTAKLATTQPE